MAPLGLSAAVPLSYATAPCSLPLGSAKAPGSFPLRSPKLPAALRGSAPSRRLRQRTAD